ncbi:MAG TPA: hypothetical protein VLA34_12140, partial [Candidatus Krumholzibacterium sp.]|nr:hypothetical protein [Candidatus Krumholzibacterium sp.]
MRYRFLSLFCLFYLLTALSFSAATGDGKSDVFLQFTRGSVEIIPPAAERAYVVPDRDELNQWSEILAHFRAGRYDSAGVILARYNYSIVHLIDDVTGNTFDVISERQPIRLGWGTLVYNRGWSRNLNVHVNHPVEDGNIAVIAAEFFRRSGAKWLLMGGSSKFALGSGNGADLARAGNSVFHRWHRELSDRMTVSVSLHAYNPDYYSFPVSASDVVLSNGRTGDDQWGISQISLTFRDSLRRAGFRTALAMLDSGFARLAAGYNPQAIFSNDSLGFG